MVTFHRSVLSESFDQVEELGLVWLSRRFYLFSLLISQLVNQLFRRNYFLFIYSTFVYYYTLYLDLALRTQSFLRQLRVRFSNSISLTYFLIYQSTTNAAAGYICQFILHYCKHRWRRNWFSERDSIYPRCRQVLLLDPPLKQKNMSF